MVGPVVSIKPGPLGLMLFTEGVRRAISAQLCAPVSMLSMVCFFTTEVGCEAFSGATEGVSYGAVPGVLIRSAVLAVPVATTAPRSRLTGAVAVCASAGAAARLSARANGEQARARVRRMVKLEPIFKTPCF